MSRRMHIHRAALVALCVAAVSAPALVHAQLELSTPRESPQRFAVEVKFSPYVPALDNSTGLNGKTPFSDQFADQTSFRGTPPNRGLLTQVEFDYQFFRRFGTLAVGLSGGFYQIGAPSFARFTDQSLPCKILTGEGGARRYQKPMGVAGMPITYADANYDNCLSGDSDQFNLVPLELLAVYRFDVLDKRYRIPIIPYFKIGFAYYIWWFGNSGNFVSELSLKNEDGSSVAASGASAGVIFHPGIALDLSAIDRHAALAVDREIGLNRVSIFIELHAALVNNFGIGRKLDLSDTTFNAGMAFEF